MDKQNRLDESVCERATLSAKLKEASGRAYRAEQELRESRGESLEAGGDGEKAPFVVCILLGRFLPNRLGVFWVEGDGADDGDCETDQRDGVRPYSAVICNFGDHFDSSGCYYQQVSPCGTRTCIVK